MNRQDKLKDPVKSFRLANNVDVAYYDLSKAVAADRWFIQVCCVAKLPISEKFFKGLQEDIEIVNAFKKSCDAGVSMEIIKERNFVDEQIKEDVLNQLIGQIEENSLDYVASNAFPQKLFLSRFEEFKKKYLISLAAETNDVHDEDDGPTDFSACFRD